MPPFKGVGGKKKPRVRKPTTSTGIALSQSLQLEETDALSLSNNTDRQGILHIDQNRPTGVEVVENSEDQINQYVDDNQMRYENLPNPPNNSQVHNLLDYLQSNDYQIKKLLEEKHWKEVFEGACGCNNTRSKQIALVDILSRKQIEVKFSGCQSDQVRLIQMGYMGGSPKFTQTAFSI
ncbi:hypothetical protein PSTG_05426 [Puccinia striiformis f. sp. tritici PST-78]|uniref:CxC1-like cysteine cluster associated with KDZ transposases domain-containing protein n=1 Tax=Puccinia striiformis f. sp. tritici PST-78 TaxID=1165861 RepID=A0A0L0VQ39_9BASI|nr:hypothetical protein PSTG_05426 [Puccinia striiformis f. sp. tritici PST-78]